MRRSARGPALAWDGVEGATVPDLFARRVREHPDRVALRAPAAGGATRPEEVTWGGWDRRSRRFGAALVEAGIEPGEKVAVFAGNRVLWPLADVGAVRAGLVGLGLYPSSAPAQVRRVLADGGASVVVVDTEERLGRVLEVRDDLPELRRVVCQDAAGDGVTGWDEWMERGGRALAGGAAEELERRASAVEPGDTAVLIYTSGSTGEPKGARITHRCLLASAASIRQALGLRADDTTMSFLPFCHSAERVFGLYTRILCGMEAALVEDVGRLWDVAVDYAPTVFGGLPRFYEKIHAALGGPDGGSWQDFLGSRVRLATSGGATLPEAVTLGLRERGLTVLGAYGLTEHLCVAMNRPDRRNLATSGPPMPGTELRIAEDGEVLVRRGPLTFDGYHGRPEATREAFTGNGEWLRTGDLGELDDEGLLRITGRKKELLALSTGKMIAPAPVEAALAGDPTISRAVVFGEGRKFVSALIVPADDGSGPAEERLKAAVRRVNRDLSRTESVRRFLVAEADLSVAAGELTPTGKVRRERVAERWSERLDALYRGEAGVDVDAGDDAGPEVAGGSRAAAEADAAGGGSA